MSPTLMPDIRNIDRNNGPNSTDLLSRTLISRVRILPLDTMRSQTRFQAITGNKRFEIDDAARCLLDYLREPRSVSDLLATAERQGWRFNGGAISSTFIEEQLVKNGLAAFCDSGDETAAGGTAESRTARPRGYEFLTLHRDILSQATLRPVTRLLATLLGPKAVFAGTILSILAHGMFLARFWHGTRPVASGPHDWVTVCVLVYASVLWHELGHASACQRFGAEHGPIGIGMYIMYPVMYCNVTGAWNLPRMQRVYVDGAGMYFHCLFSSACCILALQHPSRVFGWVIASIWAMILFNANPFLKFDGYWVLSDLLGVSGLHRISTAILRSAILRKKDARMRRELSEMPRSLRITLAGYAILYAGLIFWFFDRIVRRMIPHSVESLLHDVPLIFSRIKARQLDVTLLHQMFGLGVLLFFTYFGLRFIISIVQAMIRGLRER